MTTCRFCHQPFTPPKPTTTICESCYYQGRHLAEERQSLIDQLVALPGVDTAEIQHTGGGCFGLAITLRDKRYCFATVAFQQDGEWVADAFLPYEPTDRWAMSVCTNEEALFDGTEPGEFLLPLTDEELVAAVQERAR